MTIHKRRWPWWARRELVLPYLAFTIVTAGMVIGAGYWLTSLIAAWRIGVR